MLAVKNNQHPSTYYVCQSLSPGSLACVQGQRAVERRAMMGVLERAADDYGSEQVAPCYRAGAEGHAGLVGGLF